MATLEAYGVNVEIDSKGVLKALIEEQAVITMNMIQEFSSGEKKEFCVDIEISKEKDGSISIHPKFHGQKNEGQMPGINIFGQESDEMDDTFGSYKTLNLGVRSKENLLGVINTE